MHPDCENENGLEEKLKIPWKRRKLEHLESIIEQPKQDATWENFYTYIDGESS